MRQFDSLKTQIIVFGILIMAASLIIGIRKDVISSDETDTAEPVPTVAALVSASPEESPAPSAMQPVSAPIPLELIDSRRVIGNNVCLREKADQESANLDFLYFGNEVKYISEQGEWTEVSLKDKTGFVHSEYLCPVLNYPELDGNLVSEYALTLVGTKYKWGGVSPETGFDCSGFLQYVFNHFDIPLNRIASDQALNGTPVDKENIQPGDIICFKYGGKITHCAIYTGEGRAVHAANEKYGVNTAALDDFVGAELIIRRMS